MLRPERDVKIKTRRFRRYLGLLARLYRRRILMAIFLLVGFITILFAADVNEITNVFSPKIQGWKMWTAYALFISPLLVLFFYASSALGALYSRYVLFTKNSGQVEKIADKVKMNSKLPPWPDNYSRLRFTLGEVHDYDSGDQIENPTWMTFEETDLYTNIIAFGGTGSGKTATILKPAIRQILEYQKDVPEKRCGLFLLDVKGDFWEYVQEIAKMHNREENLVILRPGPGDVKWAYNPFVYHDLSNEVMANLFQSVAEVLNDGGGEQDSFWTDNTLNLASKSIGILRLHSLYPFCFDENGNRRPIEVIRAAMSDPEVYDAQRGYFNAAYFTFIDVNDMINIDARRDQVIREVEQVWQALADAGFCEVKPLTKEAIEEAERKARDAAEKEEHALSEGKSAPKTVSSSFLTDTFVNVLGYWHNEFVQLAAAEREMGIIKGMAKDLFGKYSSPDLRPVFAPTKEELADPNNPVQLIDFYRLIDEGWLFVLDMPVEKYTSVAKAVGALLKADFFRNALLRITPEKRAMGMNQERFILMLIDEYQVFVSKNDQEFYSRNRQSKVGAFVATQTYPSLLAEIPEDKAKPMLGNLLTKISLTCPDKETGEYFSSISPEVMVETESSSFSTDQYGASSESKSISREKKNKYDPGVLNGLHRYEVILSKGENCGRVFTKPFFHRRDASYYALAEAGAKYRGGGEEKPIKVLYAAEPKEWPEWTLAKHEGDNYIYSPDPVRRAIFSTINKITFGRLEKFLKKVGLQPK